MANWLLTLFVLSGFGLTSPSACQWQPPPPFPDTTQDRPDENRISGPYLVCDEPIHDFGTVWIGPKLKHEFEVRNIGSETAWVKPSIVGGGSFVRCRFSIPPGDAVRLPVVIKTNKLRSRFEKSISLTLISPPADNVCLDCWRSYESEKHLQSCGPVCGGRHRWCVRSFP